VRANPPMKPPSSRDRHETLNIMKKLLLLTTSLMITAALSAQIIHVPAGQPTIQAGIDAATNGDTVLVEQGTYFENIKFNGKAITVASNYLIEKDSSHIYNTIINGSQPVDPDIGTVVTFDSNTDTTSCLHGFTITGGSGTTIPYFFPNKAGGGVFFYEAGGKLMSNIIMDNECILDTLDGGVYGGGIASGTHGSDHLIVIRKNIIQNNRVWTKGDNSVWNMGWAEGGAMQLAYNSIVEENVIESNLCQSDNGISVGGAIRICSDPINVTFQSLVVLENNMIKYNQSKSVASGAFGGGISCSAGNAIIKSNEIVNNSIESQNYCRGAGLYFDLINTYYARVNSNNISNNFSLSGSSNGGAIGLYQSIDIELCNNLIENNSVDNGGAFYINHSQPLLISNNTILHNTASFEGGAFYIFESSEVVVFNSIMRSDSANGLPNEIFVESGSAFFIEYSNIKGLWSGDGNINADPLFDLSGPHPYALMPNSPCIDAGTPDTTGLCLPICDIIGCCRIWDGDGDGIAVIDMGAYEFGSPLVRIPQSKIENPKSEITVYPNPFHSSVTIEFELLAKAPVTLQVYNHLGQMVAELANETREAGTHRINWDSANLPTGMYYCRLITAKKIHTVKIIKTQ